jgi:hypothetical protein
MKKGYLSEYFNGIAIKKLSAVEANRARSHQHEYNGISKLKSILGTKRQNFNAIFLYLSDDDPEPIVESGRLTWYESRKPPRSEYRFYYTATSVSENASEGDLLLVARRPDDTLLVIIAEANSTIQNQILWLFGVSPEAHPGFSVKGEIESNQMKLEFASKFILGQIGIDVEETDENYLDVMLRKFKGIFPPTNIFSEYSRSTLKGISFKDDPDAAIIAYLEREEVLFRTLEKHLIGDRLRVGFADNVESFINFSLSVQNRRKSRAGRALENHLEFMFSKLKISYTRTAITEGRSKPDFLFPGEKQYHTSSFPDLSLTMLGVKSSCKDRWRQILAEADRISLKHLFTLEPGISENQTDEMKTKKVQLVLPEKIHATYQDGQKGLLMNLSEFIKLVKKRSGQV